MLQGAEPDADLERPRPRACGDHEQQRVARTPLHGRDPCVGAAAQQRQGRRVEVGDLRRGRGGAELDGAAERPGGLDDLNGFDPTAEAVEDRGGDGPPDIGRGERTERRRRDNR